MMADEGVEPQYSDSDKTGKRFLETLTEVASHIVGLRHAPGCHVESLPHPTREGKCVKVALVDEHRFAFAFWVQWRGEEIAGMRRGGRNGNETDLRSPTLISLDWHNDVGCTGDYNPQQLCHLDKGNENLLGLFSWICLPGNNDGHILPAVYLNAVDNVYVLLKQLGTRPDKQNREHRDRGDQAHEIRYFAAIEELIGTLEDTDPSEVILDIDLDFFTECKNGDFDSIKRVSDTKIKKVLDPSGPFMKTVLPRLTGITIALEPRYCGGIQNSLHILRVIDRFLFLPSLFHQKCGWRHISR
jgi:hypothetical protein